MVNFRLLPGNTLSRAFKCSPVAKEHLNPLFHHQSCKMLKRPVKGFFGRIGETAAWKLLSLQVVLKTFAAYALSAARIIAAIAVFQVLFLFAFHNHFLLFG